jgi:hypothetical protein
MLPAEKGVDRRPIKGWLQSLNNPAPDSILWIDV